MKLITVLAILWILMPPTAMSTSSCICESDAELTVVTDRYPTDTSWKIEIDDESCGAYSEEGGSYANSETEYTHTLTNLCDGFSYTFTIIDSYGDGICCTYGDGSYNLMVADLVTLTWEVVASGSDFGSEESTTFTVGEYSYSYTASPTSDPTTTSEPSSEPSGEPSSEPAVPTTLPTAVPSALPTTVPTSVPTTVPTAVPSALPTTVPTAVPTAPPTAVPTTLPTTLPTAVPSTLPTAVPTSVPMPVPTSVPTTVPTTPYPSSHPTPSATCVDDSSWYKDDSTAKDCVWVGKKKNKRCSKRSNSANGMIPASSVCKASCNTCFTPTTFPTIMPTPCGDSDSTTWHKWRNTNKDCEWVAKRPNKRCFVGSMKLDNGAYGDFAKEECRAACCDY